MRRAALTAGAAGGAAEGGVRSPAPRGPVPPSPLDGAGVLGLLEATGAVRRGHFRLTSGRHADTYVQCALLLQWPAVARAVGGLVAAPWAGEVDTVAAPALGGLLIGHEVAARLGARMVFTERADGAMALRRSFALEPGERVLVVEDVVTTAGSALEVRDVVVRAGGRCVGLAAIVDRRPAGGATPIPLRAAVRIDAVSWPADGCPMCRAGERAQTPGSRPTDGSGG